MKKAVIGTITTILLLAGSYWGSQQISQTKVYQASSQLTGRYVGWWGDRQNAPLKEVADNSHLIGFIAGVGACGITGVILLNAGQQQSRTTRRNSASGEFWSNPEIYSPSKQAEQELQDRISSLP
jgi:hypothetical protein